MRRWGSVRTESLSSQLEAGAPPAGACWFRGHAVHHRITATRRANKGRLYTSGATSVFSPASCIRESCSSSEMQGLHSREHPTTRPELVILGPQPLTMPQLWSNPLSHSSDCPRLWYAQPPSSERAHYSLSVRPEFSSCFTFVSPVQFEHQPFR